MSALTDYPDDYQSDLAAMERRDAARLLRDPANLAELRASDPLDFDLLVAAVKHALTMPEPPIPLPGPYS